MTRPAASGTSRLARLGFDNAERAAELLGPEGLGWWPSAVSETRPGSPAEVPPALADLARAVVPDRALLAVHRLAAAQDKPHELLGALAEDEGLRRRLYAVVGASTALGDHLAANPDEWRLLRTGEWQPEQPTVSMFRAHFAAAAGVSTDADSGWEIARADDSQVVADLRRAYRQLLLSTVARDLTGNGPGGTDVATVADELSDLADATVQTALAIAAAAVPEDGPLPRIAVIGMGKTGGQELNYVSDVDVIFVAEPPEQDADTERSLRVATTMATTMMRVCAAVAWPVDAALRPEGKDGPLVRTLASHQAYYRGWAKTWEFQALLKARPMAGDIDLAARWMAAVTPLIWDTADRPDMVSEVRAMRRRVEQALPARDAEREIKLGPGGLRDIEFAVQLLQLVHGRGDESLRSGASLWALKALTDGGYVGRGDGDALAESYRFLRTVEHRLQLQRLRRTHRIPSDPEGLRWLAAVLGYRSTPQATAVEAFTAEWHRHARQVRRLHEKLFYRPLLEAVATVSADELRMTASSARARLEVLGFADPVTALRHLEALTTGVSRRAHIQRALLPAMLHAFADAPDPDAGLLAYRSVSEQLGRTPWFLRFLRDEGQVAIRLAALLGTSRYVSDLLARDPEGLRLLADDAELAPREPAELHSAMAAAVTRSASPEAAVVSARAIRRRELLRTACADLLGLSDVVTVGKALAEVTDAVLAAALDAAERAVLAERGGPLPVRLAVIGMGRLGGAEMSYASDADVLFVYERAEYATDDQAALVARDIAERLRRLLGAPAADPPVGVDANLRPEGRQGPLVRSLESYREYYRRWSSVWEAQALLRARPVAGDQELGARFMAMVDPLRYPAGGLSTAQVTEIRRIKARVDAERLPRGADPLTHTKLGRGGLADVEWTVQLLQLEHGADVPGLRTPRTLEALGVARDTKLVTPADYGALAGAWVLATRVRNAIMLVRGRPSDQLPRHGLELSGVLRALGRPASADPGEFLDEYLRAARRGRQAVERVFHA